MQQILLLTFPFFALVLLGYAAARCRLLPLTAIPGLNVFVLYFALPAMLFRFSASTPIERLLDASTFLTYLVAALVMVAVTILLTLRRAVGWNDASFGALVAAFPNTGFMGMPLLSSIVGGVALAPVVASLGVDFIVTTSLCVGLSRLNATGDAGSGEALKKVFRGVVVNPLPWAIMGGAFLSYTGLHLHPSISKVIEMLADSGSPAALFTIGAVLARSHLQAGDGAEEKGWGDVPLVVILKLVVHPALVVALGTLAIQYGLPLHPTSLTTLALVAALPSASSITMLSERYGADTGRIAKVVMMSTALAFLSFSTAVSMLVPIGA